MSTAQWREYFHQPCCPKCASQCCSSGLTAVSLPVLWTAFTAISGTPLARMRRKEKWLSFCETLRNDLTVRVTGSPNGTEQRADVASGFMRAARVRVRYSSRSFRRHHGFKLERMNAERSHGAACCVRRWRRTSFSAETVARCIWQPLPNGGVKHRPAGCSVGEGTTHPSSRCRAPSAEKIKRNC